MSQPTPSVPAPAAPNPVSAWTLLRFIGDIVVPSRAAARTARSPMLRAWLIHVVGAILATLAVVLVAGFWSTASTTALSHTAEVVWTAFGHAFDTLDEFFTAFAQKPTPAGLSVAGILAAIEILFALVSFVFAAWGALDEPLRHTFRNALRQTWLRTSTLIPAILAVGFMGTVLQRVETRWNTAHHPPAVWPLFPTYPSVPANDPAHAQAMADYNADMAKYQAEIRRIRPVLRSYERSRPWSIRAQGPLIGLTGFVGALWFVGGLLRGVGTRRTTPPMDRPPMCESCGYNLTTLPLGARCPECGDTVLSSLGPETRPGAPWETRSSIGRFAAWRRTLAETLRRPSDFGRTLQISTAARAHRGFLLMHLPAIFVLGGIGLIGNVARMAGPGEITDDLPMSALIGCIFGCACVLGTIVVTLAIATIAGLWHGYRSKRNLLPASMQAACYLATYLLFWELFGAATACGAIALGNDVSLQALQEVSGIHREILAVWTWIIPNAICGLLFLRFVSRITQATRFANR